MDKGQFDNFELCIKEIQKQIRILRKYAYAFKIESLGKHRYKVVENCVGAQILTPASSLEEIQKVKERLQKEIENCRRFFHIN